MPSLTFAFTFGDYLTIGPIGLSFSRKLQMPENVSRVLEKLDERFAGEKPALLK